MEDSKSPMRQETKPIWKNHTIEHLGPDDYKIVEVKSPEKKKGGWINSFGGGGT